MTESFAATGWSGVFANTDFRGREGTPAEVSVQCLRSNFSHLEGGGKNSDFGIEPLEFDETWHVGSAQKSKNFGVGLNRGSTLCRKL